MNAHSQFRHIFQRHSTLGMLFLALVFSACTPAEEPAVVETPLEFPDRPNALLPANGLSQWPGSWEYRLDMPSDNLVVTGDTVVADPDVFFTNMTPGWHVSMKSPHGIFWHPASVASGEFTASMNVFLFDPGTLNEGYGLLLGGTDLQGDDQSYTYFLLRRSGEFLVKVREGAETRTVADWTAHEAIAAWTDESDTTIENTLSVQTSGDTVSFMVNGSEVYTGYKGAFPVDGVVGFRMNHGLNVHISAFDVTMAGDEATAADSTTASAE